MARQRWHPVNRVSFLWNLREWFLWNNSFEIIPMKEWSFVILLLVMGMVQEQLELGHLADILRQVSSIQKELKINIWTGRWGNHHVLCHWIEYTGTWGGQSSPLLESPATQEKYWNLSLVLILSSPSFPSSYPTVWWHPFHLPQTARTMFSVVLCPVENCF